MARHGSKWGRKETWLENCPTVLSARNVLDSQWDFPRQLLTGYVRCLLGSSWPAKRDAGCARTGPYLTTDDTDVLGTTSALPAASLEVDKTAITRAAAEKRVSLRSKCYPGDLGLPQRIDRSSSGGRHKLPRRIPSDRSLYLALALATVVC